MAAEDPLQSLARKAEKALVSEVPTREFMSRNVYSVLVGTKIHNAIKMLSTHRISGAPVINGARKIVGIVTEYDLLMQAATKDVTLPVEYTKDVLTVNPEQTLKEVLVILYSHKRKFRRLPVVNNTEEVVGIVSRIDILNQLMRGGR